MPRSDAAAALARRKAAVELVRPSPTAPKARMLCVALRRQQRLSSRSVHRLHLERWAPNQDGAAPGLQGVRAKHSHTRPSPPPPIAIDACTRHQHVSHLSSVLRSGAAGAAVAAAAQHSIRASARSGMSIVAGCVGAELEAAPGIC